MTPPSIPIPFAIGAEMWHAGYGTTSEWEPCPECEGNMAVTLIRGNGEHVSLDCACCSRGGERPSGRVERKRGARHPRPVVLGSISISSGQLTYFEMSCGTCLNPEDLYETVQECQARCDVLNAEWDRQQADQIIRNMLHQRESLAWSVHYWGRKVKELERDLEAAHARLNASRERRQKAEDGR